jgi:predicted DNA-binding ArsR family transcriptional regulator
MYTHAKFVVKKDHTITDPSILGKGVRQGDGLIRPILFNIFINDIDSIFSSDICFPVQLIDTKLNCLLYADDLLLLSESKEGLQSCLDSLKANCDRWKLKVNLNKTKIMIFSKGHKSFKKFHFFYNNLEIEIVEKYKYLGIIIYFNGNFKHAAEHLYNQSLKALFSLHSKIFGFNNIDHRLKLKLFDMFIRPICTYGSEIWISDFILKDSCIDKLPFEKIHNKFCKNILGVHKKSSNFAAKCELGRPPVLNFITILALK